MPIGAAVPFCHLEMNCHGISSFVDFATPKYLRHRTFRWLLPFQRALLSCAWCALQWEITESIRLPGERRAISSRKRVQRCKMVLISLVCTNLETIYFD